jgi:hypothetical protein
MRKKIIAALLILLFAGGIACADVWNSPGAYVLSGVFVGGAMAATGFGIHQPLIGWSGIALGVGLILGGLIPWAINGGGFFASAQDDPILKNIEVDIRPTSVTFAYSFKF